MTEPRIVVYGLRATPYTEKVVRALEFKGLDFEVREPTSPEDYRRWNPETGLLPVLELDGERIADSAVILDRLDERFPEPPLLSRDPRAARDQRRLEDWVGDTFRHYMLRWLGRKLERQDPGPGRDAEGAAMGPLARMGLIGPDGTLRPEAYDTTDGGPGPEFERRLADLAGMLGEREYFYGDRPSRADLAVFASLWSLYSGRFPGGRAILERHPNLLAHVERMERQTAGRDRHAS
jgi:glutathione S-transferase